MKRVMDADLTLIETIDRRGSHGRERPRYSYEADSSRLARYVLFRVSAGLGYVARTFTSGRAIGRKTTKSISQSPSNRPDTFLSCPHGDQSRVLSAKADLSRLVRFSGVELCSPDVHVRAGNRAQDHKIDITIPIPSTQSLPVMPARGLIRHANSKSRLKSASPLQRG
jgi:hypothetical protein